MEKALRMMGAVVLLSWLAGEPARGVNRYWVGTDGVWDGKFNWDPVGQPQDDDNVYLTQDDAVDRQVYYRNTAYPDAVLRTLHIDATGTGTMTFWMRSLYPDPLAAGTEFVGQDGRGFFDQDAGTNTAYKLYLGYAATGDGTYELDGGDLSCTYLYVGYQGVGSLTHRGGTNTIANPSLLAILFVADDPNSTGTYELAGGQLLAEQERIGVGGTAVFAHTSGTNTVDTGLLVGYGPGGSGTYTLADGQVSADYERVGYQEAGWFYHDGGTNQAESVYVGDGETGTYEISGGVLNVANLYVGVTADGTFAIADAAAQISVSNLLWFGPHSTFSAVAGGTIHLTGSGLDNFNSDPNRLMGLEQATLVFEGGSAGVDSFEVAGRDMGAVAEGFSRNFVVDTLRIGGADVGMVQLVNYRDNQDGPEALYVRNLYISAGSYLDLNGLNLYYLDGQIDPAATVELNGGGLYKGYCGDAEHPLPSGDLDGDCRVDWQDFSIFAGQWLADGCAGPDWCNGCDLDQDGSVNWGDFSVFAAHWLECTAPECD